MIISASRRTDIPAFFSEWLLARLAAGFCEVQNPFNARQVGRISLAPADVDAMVFWTRHALPLLPALAALDRRGYRYYFHYTITGYGPPLEARNPPLEVALRTFCQLAERLPLGSVIWRYDPVIVGDAFPVSGHRQRFSRIAEALAGRCDRVVVSLLERYRKTARRVGRLYAWGSAVAENAAAHPQTAELLAELRATAAAHGMRLEGCCSTREFGIPPTKCIDDRLLGRLFGGIWPDRRDPGQRPACHCIPSRDIGAVDTCTFGCAYCYSTRSDALAQRRQARHDPSAPRLVTPAAASDSEGAP
jgi:hypothetical protein